MDNSGIEKVLDTSVDETVKNLLEKLDNSSLPRATTFKILQMLVIYIEKMLQKMCDHEDVAQLDINQLQMSDGKTRYTCRTCEHVVVKDDIEFNREYKRHYGLCRDHYDSNAYVPTYKDNAGNICCCWCGIPICEKRAIETTESKNL